MLIYNNIAGILAYRNNPAINQSSLKSFDKGYTKVFTESLASIYGNILDARLTFPDDFPIEDIFYIGDFARKTGTIPEVLNYIADNLKDKDAKLDDFKTLILEKLKEKEYGNGRYAEDVVWKRVKDAEEYFNSLVMCADKNIISADELRIADEYVVLCKNHPVCKHLFVDIDGVDKYYQQDFYFDYKGFSCKGLGDILVVNHKKKKITYIDIKSTRCYNPTQWIWQAKENNLPIQMAWYKIGLEQFCDNYLQQGYTFDMMWLIIPTVNKLSPYFITVTDKILDVGLHGYKKINYYEIKGTKYETKSEFRGIDSILELFENNNQNKVIYDKAGANQLWFG